MFFVVSRTNSYVPRREPIALFTSKIHAALFMAAMRNNNDAIDERMEIVNVRRMNYNASLSMMQRYFQLLNQGAQLIPMPPKDENADAVAITTTQQMKTLLALAQSRGQDGAAEGPGEPARDRDRQPRDRRRDQTA
ncbi:MAG: hypothetical protein MH825_08350 [Cyanobacteria bacterium]|nr:hypothetical protein [Cyanobacteriota bacterium]